MSGQKNDVTYAATVAFAVAKMRELGWMPPSNTSTDPPQDDLIERLRAVKWEVTDDCGRMPDDPTNKCVFVDMRPEDFRELLRESAAALEALRRDAARWRFVAQFLRLDDVGDDQYCLGLIVNCEDLEDMVTVQAARLDGERRRLEWADVQGPEDSPKTLPPITLEVAIDAAIDEAMEKEVSND